MEETTIPRELFFGRTARTIPRETLKEDPQSLMEAINARFGGSVTNLKNGNALPGYSTLENFAIEHPRTSVNLREARRTAIEYLCESGYRFGRILSRGHYSLTSSDGVISYLSIRIKKGILKVRLDVGNPVRV